MKRRKFLAGCGCATSLVLAGCIGNNDDEETDTNGGETGTDEGSESEDMSGGYDFSSCGYDLNDEKVNAPLDDSQFNDPSRDDAHVPEYDGVNVGIGYQEDIEDDELEELDSIFGDEKHSEDTQGYSTPRDAPIDKCDVAKLSNRDYIEYIVPIPIDEP